MRGTTKIVNVYARQIFDSRGNPTAEADVELGGGVIGRAAVPSGASTGTHEALELRDGDRTRFLGKGVDRAIANINGPLADAVRGKDVIVMEEIDSALLAADGTPNKSKLGANAILAVSMAAARSAAEVGGRPLYEFIGGEDARVIPIPQMNFVNGGAHGGVVNGVPVTDIQEYMFVPSGARTFRDAMQMASETYQLLKRVLVDAGYPQGVGDEGGFNPFFDGRLFSQHHGESLPLYGAERTPNTEPLLALTVAAQKAGYTPGKEIAFALDVAATGLWDQTERTYVLTRESEHLTHGKRRNQINWVSFLRRIADAFPIVSVEDPLAEDDWEGWSTYTREVAGRHQVVADDLIVTNPERIRRAIDELSANAALIKLNQIGTLTETLAAIELARAAGWNIVISHRSGETDDAFIADLAVATNAGQIKTGGMSRGERTAKYNQLLRIEEALGGRAVYAGIHAPAEFNPLAQFASQTAG